MQFGIVNIIAIVGALFAVVEMGLTAYLVDNTFPGTPSELSFMVFNSVWSLAVLAYLILTPMFVTKIYNKLVALILNAITCLFWFAGSIALAVLYRHCDNGSYYCGNARAAVVFGFLLWVVFTALTVLDGLDWSRNRGASGGVKGPHAYPGA